MQWLCEQFSPDARWQLVHATHSTAAEIEQVAASGAGLVICPSTEANLAGQCRLRGGRRLQGEAIATRYQAVLAAL